MTLLVVATESSLLESAWAFVQQVATLAVALITIWAAVVRPSMARREKKRQAEIAARDEARKQEIVTEVEKVVAPLRQKVDAIHHTTTVNGGQNDPPTMRDDMSNLRKQQDNAIKAVGQVAVNQAYLSDRFDQHERDSMRFLAAARQMLIEQGIELPEPVSSLPPRFDDDPD